MRIDEILEAMRGDLQTFAKANKARLVVASDLLEALKVLFVGSQGFVIVLHWAGDEAKGDEPQSPLATNLLDVFVGNNPGLEALPTLAVLASSLQRPSLLKLVDRTRARVLTIQFPTEGDETSQFLGYGGATPVVLPDGVPLAAYKFRVRLDAMVETDETYREVGV